ncbi:MAG: hypothetical protein ACJ77M_13890 [Thermoleophilaceae bacterium]
MDATEAGPALAASASAAEFFDRLRASFDTAARRAGGAREHGLAIGPWGVRVLFAGGELEPLMLPPLEHRRVAAPGEPAATICVWDSASTGLPVPSFNWRPRHVRERGVVDLEGFNDERFRTMYHGDLMADDGGFQALSMYDAESRTAIFWVASSGHVHFWERAEPLRPSLNWILDAPSRYFAHAACVGNDEGAVLLAGKGGSGKTTTTMASVEAGMKFLADNYALISLEEGGPVAYSLYSNAKLLPRTVELIPRLREVVDVREVAADEKLTVDIREHRPAQLVSGGLPVRALVVPHVVGRGETRLVEISAVQALIALAPTTVLQLQNSAVVGRMADLARTVPSYRLELGGDVEDGPRALQGLLEEG